MNPSLTGRDGLNRTTACLRAIHLALASLLVLVLAGCGRPTAMVPRSGEAQRIVSLAPSLTEILFAIGAGDSMVGRTDVCNYPSAAETVPVVGRFGRPLLEAMAVQKPSHVWYVDLEDQSQPALFQRLGWSAEQIPCNRLDDIPTAILTLGHHTGRTNEATRLAADLSNGVAARRSAAAASNETKKAPSVLVVVWWDPLMTVGEPSFIADLVTLAGGRLITEEMNRDYFTISEEWVLRQNPDVIVCLDAARPGAAADRLRAATGWRALAAVTSGRIYDDFNLDTLCRPGPRVLEGADQFHAVFYAAP